MGFHTLFGFYAAVTLAAWHVLSECPRDSARRAQTCFTDLARGVATVDDSDSHGSGSHDNDNTAEQQRYESRPGTRTMPLDYRKIREYCEERGHMVRFVRCVEDLSVRCPELPPEAALYQLINPQRVRTSVPRLCSNVDKVEAKSACMNREMNRRTSCKDRAYDIIKSGLAMTTQNSTAMFFVQCRFFSVIAECQRFALSEKCGQGLGDLHADFLLSFVPNVCAASGAADLREAGQGRSFADMRTKGRDLLNDGEKKDPEGASKGQDYGEATVRKGQGQSERTDHDEEQVPGESAREGKIERLIKEAESEVRQTQDATQKASGGTQTLHNRIIQVTSTPLSSLSYTTTERHKNSPEPSVMGKTSVSSINSAKKKATLAEPKRPISKIFSSVILPTKDAALSGTASDRLHGKSLLFANCLIISLYTFLIV